ncbi:hypothetical protein Dda_7880 [Drechslerella dactyloides]|uniref:Uncharacterized protein n=1 Tax=Drechslerella dactyloides TaxID=74499 RepID=A0AAD6IRC4_DREDA|nr:hypothetical protein Dda_7880 [Drechslerella dactyloides]
MNFGKSHIPNEPVVGDWGSGFVVCLNANTNAFLTTPLQQPGARAFTPEAFATTLHEFRRTLNNADSEVSKVFHPVDLQQEVEQLLPPHLAANPVALQEIPVGNIPTSGSNLDSLEILRSGRSDSPRLHRPERLSLVLPGERPYSAIGTATPAATPYADEIYSPSTPGMYTPASTTMMSGELTPMGAQYTPGTEAFDFGDD